MKIPIPGLKKEVGAGDVVKAATSAVGVKPCGGCKKRAEALSKALQFVPTGAKATPSQVITQTTWENPPAVPEGWELIKSQQVGTVSVQFFEHAVSGATCIWDVMDGHYRNYRGFCCPTVRYMADAEWSKICRT